jgi:hypothetical protein
VLDKKTHHKNTVSVEYIEYIEISYRKNSTLMRF